MKEEDPNWQRLSCAITSWLYELLYKRAKNITS